MRAALVQRLKRLEARVKPADEPEEFVIEFIGPEKEVVGRSAFKGQQEWRYTTGQRLGTRERHIAASQSFIPLERAAPV